MTARDRLRDQLALGGLLGLALGERGRLGPGEREVLGRRAPSAAPRAAAAPSSGDSPSSVSSTAGHSSSNASSDSSTPAENDGSGVGASGSTVATAVTAGAGSSSVASSAATAAAASSAAASASGAPPSGAPGSVVEAATGGWPSTCARTATLGAAGGGRGLGRVARRRGRAGAPASRASSRSIRASSALVDGSCAGSARLHERELELGAGVGAVLERAQRGGDQLQQAHDVAGRDRLRLRDEPLVLLGRDAQLGRQLAERLHDHQRARVRLEVAEEAAEVAARVGQPRGGEQRRARVAGGDGVDGAEHEVGVGGAEHRQHVLERDAAARVGDELLERAERVAERAGGASARPARSPRRRDLDLLRGRRPCGARRRSAARSAARSRTGGSGPRPSAGPCSPRSWRARRSCAAAAPRASSGTRSTPPSDSMCASSRM